MGMKVWLVSGSWNYEGADSRSVKVFGSRERAEVYAEELRGGNYFYDSVDVRGAEVE